MPAPSNHFKNRLKAGECLHGIWLGFADPYAAEMAATAGFDWLLIDGEHAPNDVRSIMAQLAILDGKESAAVVRLPDDDPTRIKQALDIGAQNLLIPMVESAEQAERCIRAANYPPKGFRGVGSALARASKFGGIPDYLATANDEILVLLQVESRRGLDALDDILAIEGVDGVFIGPSDLAADMGYLGNVSAPPVREAVLDALRRIRAAGRIAGVLSADSALIEDCKNAGANFVGVGIDVSLFTKALRTLAAQYRS
ncbi:HpcH/HpaI aldolase/citrate lyase family protein [Rhizobium sp. ARZ01]|uniref:aldolase/citrate lyase family protein n=1 Tax=Rhizobium sp. ARZ01 TaxID=2769313 RepID=UPI00178051AE|nr:HpcH/HpaI aldolase/citrate lyase family protein [Rhizobium sp. ARZ01]MBD9375222.1 HpcH/HpaI aldolase/citrate lyase family protein [Rhizobium sp. ARZ01]